MSTQLIDDTTGFDEPTDEAPATTTKAALAITDDMSRISNAIGEFDRVSAGLADLESRYPKDVIYEVGTTKGMKAALEHRAAYRDPRISVEKTRRSAKAPVIALGKNIDARAAWLTDRLREGEDPVDQQIKAEEARKEAEREAKAAAEFGRVLAIQEALADIAIEAAAASNKTSDDISALLERLQTTQPDQVVFQEMMDQAKAAWAAAIVKLEIALKAKLWEESEQRRIAAVQEAARVAAQAAAEAMERQRLENERVAAEQKAAADRLAAERAEFERQQAEFRAQQKAAAQAQREREEAEARTLVRESVKVAEAIGLQEPDPQPYRASFDDAQSEIMGIQQQVAIATCGRLGVRVGGTIECIRETLAETEALTIGDHLHIFKGAAQAAKDKAVEDIRALLAKAEAGTATAPAPAPEVRAFPAAAAANEAPTLSLGEVKARIAPLQIDAAGLESLGFPATKVKASCMYRESQWPDMHAAMVKKLSAAGPQQKAA